MSRAPATVARVLDRALAENPDREALVTRARRLTFAELDRLADQAAHALRALGVGRGDRVAATLPNEADVVIAFHGAMRLGAVWVGINRVLAPPEKLHLLSDSGATLWLTADAPAVDAPADDAPAVDAPAIGSASVDAASGDLASVGTRVVDLATWGAAVAAAPSGPIGVDVDPFAPAGLAYTSGTTGRPKGAVHSQHNLLLPGAVLVETRGYDASLRKGDCFAFTILNMAVLTTLLTAQAGGTSIVMDRMDAEGVAEWIRDEAITTWNGPPALLHSLAAMDSILPSDLASLDEVWTGGADCPEVIRSAFASKFGLPVLATYGLSEAPTVVAIDARPAGRGAVADHVAGASGRPLPHLRVRIADRDGSTLPVGETGEIRVAAADDRYRLMLGYWDRPEATAETLAGDELHTGDLGFLDAEGYLHVRDRTSLLIIRGGANVYPAEVERVLQEYPAVAAGAVLGVADERLGERVAALVEPAGGATIDLDELRAHLLANLARYKVPERITVVDSLPRNAMGKIVRTALPELL